MYRVFAALVTLALCAAGATGALAHAQNASAPNGCTRESIFGTITGPEGPNRFNMQTLRTRLGHVDVDTRAARINANGLTIRQGVFVGVFGCFAAGDRIFRAEEVTLSTTPQDYNGYRRATTTITGTVTAIQPGRLALHTPNYGNLYVYTSRTGYSIGERLEVTGNFSPQQDAFNAATIRPLP